MHDGGPVPNSTLATAIITSWSAATAFWFWVAAIIWKFFFEPRVKELREQLADEKAAREKDRENWQADLREERARCERDIATLNARINQLETVLLMHGPQSIRQPLQAAISEVRVEDKS